MQERRIDNQKHYINVNNHSATLTSDFDKRAVNVIRKLALDQIQKANSGHPGIALGAAPIIYAVFSNFLNFNVSDPNWKGRDRFVLSAGHGSALLYSVLFYFGYLLTLDDLKQFRCLGSITPGHPRYWSVPGIETTTGPLGQGIGNAVGMAFSEQWLCINIKINKATYKKDIPSTNIFNNFTYCVCSDGCLQEGISYEAMSFAGHHKLEKLILLYDSNQVQLDGPISENFSDKMEQRAIGAGWEYFQVANGDSVSEITNVIRQAQSSTSRKPKFIEVKTIIGIYSENANHSKVHGAPLSETDYKQTIQNLGFNDTEQHPFWFDSVVLKKLSEKLLQRTLPKYEIFEAELDNLFKYDRKRYEQFIMRETACNFSDLLESTKKYDPFEPTASRDFVGEMVDHLSKNNENLIGGSADLSCSTRIGGANGIFDINKNPNGREIRFGVRENVMVSIVTGINLYGCQNSFGSSFLSFFDNAKLSTRLAAMVHVRTLSIYSHDSIFLGEDGETHQPVEQIGNLRSIPELDTWRPFNQAEAAAALNFNFVNDDSRANVIITSRQKYFQIPTLQNAIEIQRGGYVIQYEGLNKPPKIILLASGSEVEIALRLAAMFEGLKIPTRVISVPCLTRFIAKENEQYLSEITYKHEPEIFVIEAGNCSLWYKLIPFSFHTQNYFGVSEFGKSGTEQDLKTDFGLTAVNIFQKIFSIINVGTKLTIEQLNLAILCNENRFAKIKRNPITTISTQHSGGPIKSFFSLFHSKKIPAPHSSTETPHHGQQIIDQSTPQSDNISLNKQKVGPDLSNKQTISNQTSDTVQTDKQPTRKTWFTKFTNRIKKFKFLKN